LCLSPFIYLVAECYEISIFLFNKGVIKIGDKNVESILIIMSLLISLI
jgi:hypothetical protein